MVTLAEGLKIEHTARTEQPSCPRKNVPTVLLLEDDPDIGDMLTHWAQQQGIRPIRALTVSEACHLISDLELVGSSFHGLLADYRLPDATGVRVIQEFKAAFPRRPVALVTAYHDLSVAIWAQANAIPIFLKPLDRPLLLRWLHAVAAST